MIDIRPMDWIDLGASALQLSIWVVAVCLICLIAGHAYRDRSIVTAGRRGLYAVATALTVAFGGLAAAFLSEGAYDIRFVWTHSDTSLEWFFQLAGAWAGQEGSLLFWTWILSVFGAVLAFSLRRRGDRAATLVLIVFAVVQLYFCCIVVLLEQNPFKPFERDELVQRVLTTGDGQNVRVARQAVEWLTGNTVEGSEGRVTVQAVQPADLSPAVLDGRVTPPPTPRGLTFAQVVPQEVIDELLRLQAEPLPAHLAPKKLAGMVVDGAHAQGFSVVGNGNGLNPLLANYWIAIHPPCMYTGLIGCAVVFAFALGSLLGGRVDDWVRDVRPWLLFVWLFLGVGNVLGGLWAYEELGWGGFWDWDPVENAAFVPWLIATALLHTIIAQDRRRVYRAFNVILAAALFGITVWSTWVTRSGAISSIHAFAEGPMIGYALLSAVGVTMAFTTLVVVHRLPLLRGRVTLPASDQPPPKPAGRLESLFSREVMLLGGGIVLLLLLVMIVGLTMWPLLSWRFGGEEAMTRDRYWITMPFFVLVFALMGAGMALPWRKPRAHEVKPRLLWPALIGLGVAIVTFVMQLLADTQHWVAFTSLPDAASGKWNDAIAAIVIPLMPPLIWGTAVFAFLTLGMEFHLPAAMRARHRLAGKPEPPPDTGDDSAAPAPAVADSPATPASATVGQRIGAYIVSLWRVLWSNRRRYGGYVTHIGALMLLVGICAATMFKTEEARERIPLGGAVGYEAGFPTASTYVWTLRRFEVGVRLAIDNDELADRAVRRDAPIDSALITGSQLPVAGDPRVEPTVLVRRPGAIGSDSPLPQITATGELPVAIFEAPGALGEHGQLANSRLDMEIRQLFVTLPGPKAARAYIPANRDELMRLFNAGQLGRLLTYFYGRSYLELRVDPPAIRLDLSAAVSGEAAHGELLLDTEAGQRRLTFSGRADDEHPQAAWRRITNGLTQALMPLGVAVLANPSAPSTTEYHLRLVPTGVSRSLNPAATSRPGFLAVASSQGLQVVGESRVEVVDSRTLAVPTIRRYARGNQQITREADILQGLTADEFVVPTDFLVPDDSDPGGPGRTGFRFHHNPMMTWNLIAVAIVVLGTIVCLWPSSSRRRRDAASGSGS